MKKVKILTIVGARPQFIKAAVVSRTLRKHKHLKERILHTGQHYNPEMSSIFFQELDIPLPYKNLNIGSGSHGTQTGKMIQGVEKECLRIRPDMIVIHGDTNSTLAGALAAAKLHIPVAHVESGLRSYNWKMPEEVNRVLSDRISVIRFCPTQTAVKNLKKEGIKTGVYRVGDVMIDAIYYYQKESKKIPSSRLRALAPFEEFFLLTLHRPENTDHPFRLKNIFHGLAKSPLPFLFPIHPRTRKTLRKLNLSLPKTIHLMPPISYLEMIWLQSHSKAVWTDSGGMQKEAVVLGVPCFTLRDETEWIETVQFGWNQLVGADSKKILRALTKASRFSKRKPFPVKRFYGNGKAGEKIAKIIARTIKTIRSHGV